MFSKSRRRPRNFEKSRPVGPDRSEPAISGDHPASSTLKRLRGRDVNCGNAHGIVAVRRRAVARHHDQCALSHEGVRRRISHEDRNGTCARVDSSCGKKERLTRVETSDVNADDARPHFCVRRDSINPRSRETQCKKTEVEGRAKAALCL